MKLRTHILAAVLALVVGAAALPVHAEENTDYVDGTVTKMDESAGKITIKHGALTKFGMDDGMTMVFHTSDPAMFKEVKPGDKVRFVPDRVNGQFTVAKIEKAK